MRASRARSSTTCTLSRPWSNARRSWQSVLCGSTRWIWRRTSPRTSIIWTSGGRSSPDRRATCESIRERVVRRRIMAKIAPEVSDTMKTPVGADQAQQPEHPQTISGGHLVAKALKAEGIDTIFTLCGGHIIDIYDGCVDEGIKVVDVRHEQVAAHAADGYARVTGRPGCAVVTAGPGTTDAVTGVANAFRAESAMLLIGGQGALDQHRMGSLQDLPHVDILKPITKFASSVYTTDRIADMIAMAFRECYNGALGPAYLEIGRDILDAHVPLEDAVLPQPGHYRASTKSIGDPNDVDKLTDILIG